MFSWYTDNRNSFLPPVLFHEIQGQDIKIEQEYIDWPGEL